MYKRKVAKDHEAAEKKKGEERIGAIVAFVAFCARKNEKKKEARSEYMQLIAFCAKKKKKPSKRTPSLPHWYGGICNDGIPSAELCIFCAF